jgi:hypothetical protein
MSKGIISSVYILTSVCVMLKNKSKKMQAKKDILLELLILNIFDDHIFKSHSISKLNSYDHESGSLF